MIDITGLDPADVLCALYNASRPQGLGFMHYIPGDITHAEADAMLRDVGINNEDAPYFDYVHGRVMKVAISNPLDPRLYDRNNGEGSAARVIDALRANQPDVLTEMHASGLKSAAREVKENLNKPSTTTYVDDVAVFTLGLSDVANELNNAVDKALE